LGLACERLPPKVAIVYGVGLALHLTVKLCDLLFNLGGKALLPVDLLQLQNDYLLFEVQVFVLFRGEMVGRAKGERSCVCF
jgi:hypothetical protein